MEVPKFFKADPQRWFTQVEAYFHLNKVADDETKYHIVVGSIDMLDVLTEARDIIMNPPICGKYDAIKKRLLPTVESFADCSIQTEKVQTGIKDPDTAETEELAFTQVVDCSPHQDLCFSSQCQSLYSAENSTSSFQRQLTSQHAHVESSTGDNKFEMEPPELLEQTLTTDSVHSIPNAGFLKPSSITFASLDKLEESKMMVETAEVPEAPFKLAKDVVAIKKRVKTMVSNSQASNRKTSNRKTSNPKSYKPKSSNPKSSRPKTSMHKTSIHKNAIHKPVKQNSSIPPAPKVKPNYDSDIADAFNQFGKRKGLTVGELKVYLAIKRNLDTIEAVTRVKSYLNLSIKKGTVEKIEDGTYKVKARGKDKKSASSVPATRKRKIVSSKPQTKKSKSSRRKKASSPKKARRSSKKGRSDKDKTSQRRKEVSSSAK